MICNKGVVCVILIESPIPKDKGQDIKMKCFVLMS